MIILLNNFINKYLFYNNNLYEKNNIKIILILSNIVYLYYLLHFFIDKNMVGLIIMTTIFCVSLLYHISQCLLKDDYCLFHTIDVIMCFTVLIFILVKIIINNNISNIFNIEILILIILCLFSFNIFGTHNNYIISHSIWHIFSGMLIYKLINCI